MNRPASRLALGLLPAGVAITAWAQSGSQDFGLQSIGCALVPAPIDGWRTARSSAAIAA